MKPSGLFLAWLMVFFPVMVSAEVRLPPIFGDHMVLQRDGTVPVWGTAAPGESVTVAAGTARGSAVAGSDGKWLVRLNNLPASDKPIEMTVAGTNTIIFHDVLVGDVWLCSGQSNMEFGERQESSAKEDLPKFAQPSIRLFCVPKISAPMPADTFAPPSDATLVGAWQVCTPETVGEGGTWLGFSAVAANFGLEIRAATHQPVGLIQCCWPGTEAEVWVSREALAAEPLFQHAAAQAAAGAAAPPEMASTPAPPAGGPPTLHNREWSKVTKPARGAAVLYNGMIHPILPYGLKGVIWYQGEGNAARPIEYRTLFPVLIRDWRARWGQGDSPFLYVQLANYVNHSHRPKDCWSALQEAQARTLALPNVGMAVAADLGEPNAIHPRDKVDVAHRLALAARKIAYGENIIASGPTYRVMKVEGAAIRLSFDQVGEGLTAGVPPPHFHPGQPRALPADLQTFTIAGADQNFVPAQAVIQGGDVLVSAPGVTSPVAVRYGWGDGSAINLYNKEGLPAPPFRTDDWPLEVGAAKK